MTLSLIALECPECGLTSEQFLGDLARSPKQECRACGAAFQINLAQLPAPVGLTKSLLPAAGVLLSALKGLLVEAPSK